MAKLGEGDKRWIVEDRIDGNSVVLSPTEPIASSGQGFRWKLSGEDPEIRITIKDDGPIDKRFKETFISKGFVFEKLKQYVEAMARGEPTKEDLDRPPALALSPNLIDCSRARLRSAASPSRGRKRSPKLIDETDEPEFR
ncbi:activator of 90 kDa heat shock protein [Striga asiatica]|uniref:Activator of 90 kDa heat shock protein n=1 Tax=Striga asiatica TaxID=4170 RepID=A0A5A7PQ25_STRAF|nr:activator of 90 kDa heat shock protein [Striga asiatica]